MAYTLSYRRGSFKFSATFDDLQDAVAEARKAALCDGAIGFSIVCDGLHYLGDTEIRQLLEAADAKAGAPHD